MGQQPIVLSDCRIKMTANSLEKYPQGLRLVSACVLVNGKPCDMNFITNNFDWSACFCHKTSMNHFMGYLWIYAKNITDISQKTTDGGVSRPISRLAALASRVTYVSMLPALLACKTRHCRTIHPPIESFVF